MIGTDDAGGTDSNAARRTAVCLTEDGTYEGLMGVVRGITERKARELERYETVVETTTDPIYVLDDEERFVRVNDAMTGELGYDRGELLGSHLSTVVSEADARKQETLVTSSAP